MRRAIARLPKLYKHTVTVIGAPGATRTLPNSLPTNEVFLMFDEAALLLERTISNLEVLADLMLEDVGERSGTTTVLQPPAAALLSAQHAIQTMLPKLQAASDVWRMDHLVVQRVQRGCVNCED